MTKDLIPPHAFPGGVALERGNEEMFIGRAPVDDDLIPGTIYVHCKTCYMPSSYPECQRDSTSFEVLVVPEKMPKQLIWHPPKRRRNSDYED